MESDSATFGKKLGYEQGAGSACLLEPFADGALHAIPQRSQALVEPWQRESKVPPQTFVNQICKQTSQEVPPKDHLIDIADSKHVPSDGTASLTEAADFTTACSFTSTCSPDALPNTFAKETLVKGWKAAICISCADTAAAPSAVAPFTTRPILLAPAQLRNLVWHCFGPALTVKLAKLGLSSRGTSSYQISRALGVSW